MMTAVVTAMMTAVVTAMMTAVVTAMMTAVVTAMTAVAMTGERGHGKQHGSSYRANKRELPKHEFLRGQFA
jgi:hypothetical protein